MSYRTGCGIQNWVVTKLDACFRRHDGGHNEKTPSGAFFRILCPFDVVAGVSVDAEQVTFFDEKRYAQLQTGLESDRFRR